MKQLNEYSITELKAIAYDQLTSIERSQQVLRTINEELNRRAQMPPVKENKDEQQVPNSKKR